jgi:hydroxymethylglutaryl-CoA synthase
VLTLAWAAGTAALTNGGLGAAEVDGLWWGTTRPPWAEGPSWAVLAAALGLRDDAAGGLSGGSAHAGMEALLSAWDAVAAGSVGRALVIVADAIVPGLGTSLEQRTGAGAVAFVLAPDGGAGRLVGRVTRAQPVLDRYRGDLEDATRDLYDPRLFREEVFLPSLTAVGSTLGDVGAWSVPDPDGRLGATVAKKLGAANAVSASVDALVGDTGAAQPFLGALPAMVAAGTVAVLAYGGGRTSGVTIETTGAVPGAGAALAALEGGRAAAYAEVLRARGQLVPSGEPVPMGIPPASAGFVRGNPEMLRLLGARCVDCGTFNIPPSIHPTCTGCGGSKMEEVALARRGKVHTFVVNHTMPAPFVAPLPLVVVDLEDGARVMLQGLADQASTLGIGDNVELLLRRYALERGAPVYGYKVSKKEG